MPDFQITPTDAVAAERERCAELAAIAQGLGGGQKLDAAVRAIRNGTSVVDFQAHLVEHHGERPSRFHEGHQ